MKPYYLGVDGGGTKTIALLADAEGDIKGVGLSGPVNYQLVGINIAADNLQGAISMALTQAGAATCQIEKAVLGLAGLDFPLDWANWTEPIAKLLPAVDVELVNDTWIALRAGSNALPGVVSVCGTGANTAGINADGTRMIGRGMTYELGCFAGASELIRMCLNAAYRSANGSGKRSMLEPTLLAATGLDSYDQLAMLMYSQAAKDDDGLMEQAVSLIPQLFQLADAGDEVVQDILIHAGKTLGEEAVAIVKGLGIEGQQFTLVLAGSIWQKPGNPLMRDAFCLSVHRIAPQAEIRILQHHPVAGAVLLALESRCQLTAAIEHLFQKDALARGL